MCEIQQSGAEQSSTADGVTPSNTFTGSCDRCPFEWICPPLLRIIHAYSLTYCAIIWY